VVLGEKPQSPSEASPSPNAAGGQPAAESDEQDM